MPLSEPLTTAEAVVFWVELLYFPLLALVCGLANALRGVLNSEDDEDSIPTRATGPGGRPLPSTKQKKKKRDGPERPPPPELEFSKLTRRLFDYGSVCVVLTFVANGAAIASHTLGGGQEGGWWCGEETACYLVGGLFLHLFVFIMLSLRKNGPNSADFILWTASLATEVCILVASYFRFQGLHHVLRSVRLSTWARLEGPDGWDQLELGIASSRVALIALLTGTYGFLHLRHRMRNRGKFDEEGTGETAGESTPLLREAVRAGYQTRSSSGANSHGPPEPGFQYQDDDAAFYRPEKLPHKTWWEYVRGYSLFFPYLWPQESVSLQFVVLVCVIILVLQRVVNFLVPNQIGIVTDNLRTSHGVMPWKDILLFIFFKLNQGQSGLLGSVRALLWIPVSQFSYRQLTTAAFEHVHSLSLSFHTSKRTGELLSALNKGASINSFLEQITFQVFPMLIDLVIAIIYFAVRFGPLYSTIATVITWYYLALTVMMAATRTNERRDMVNADREEVAVKNDSITSYETVKYFNAEPYEFQRYRNAIETYQVAEAKVTWGMNVMNVCQALVFMCGLLIMLVVGAYEVTQTMLTVGDFVVMITYLGQLQGPLNFFGTFYRTVQQSMISGERLLELFKIEPSVVDRPGVPTLPTTNGHIRWSHVHFSYEMQRTALKDLTFECVPGTTTAFVGESGGGKSTIFRLMFRYYNCQQGAIEIDGCNVKDVTIDSVRRLIGVVPQDTILFNESIMYNLKYADQDISNDEVFEACRAASIHDRIMSFPEGYNTKVGDRGLRLSGGEKQRVAIARAMLKKPKIILLDEATSALDSETEQQIQKKLIQGEDLVQDRTLLIIAHRLSTITHANQILVLHDGTIVERGTHTELLAMGGRYTSMWEKQSKAEEAATFARDASEHADRLLRRAHLVTTKKKEQEDRSDGFNSMMSSTVLQTEPPTPNLTSPVGSEASSDDESTVRTTTRQKTAIKDAFVQHPTVAEEDVDFDGSTYGTSTSDTEEDVDDHETPDTWATAGGLDSVCHAEPTTASAHDDESETANGPSNPAPGR